MLHGLAGKDEQPLNASLLVPAPAALEVELPHLHRGFEAIGMCKAAGGQIRIHHLPDAPGQGGRGRGGGNLVWGGWRQRQDFVHGGQLTPATTTTLPLAPELFILW